MGKLANAGWEASAVFIFLGHATSSRPAGENFLDEPIVAGAPWHTQAIEKSGAGEGIRTLDPNLGKVVLYP